MGKDHKNVLRDINERFSDFHEHGSFFEPCSYENEKNVTQPTHLLPTSMPLPNSPALIRLKLLRASYLTGRYPNTHNYIKVLYFGAHDGTRTVRGSVCIAV